MKKCLLLFALTVFNLYSSFSQVVDHKLKHLFTIPKSYIATYTDNPPLINGNPNQKAWDQAQWSEDFVDIEGDLKPKPYYTTRFKMLWDKEYLYIAAILEDKHVWANLDKRDQVVFYDNDFEVFLDPENTGHRYFEYEINALNTMFDLFLPKPYRAGSGALISWDSNRLKHAVQVQGTLNNTDDEDTGWTVTMAIPFADITIGNDPHIPKSGDIWRINFSRVQWETHIVNGKYEKKRDQLGNVLPENNWVWSPQGLINMHMPERWGYLVFSDKKTESDVSNFEFPYSELQRQYLWLVFYKQYEYKEKYGSFAKSLSDLGMKDEYNIAGYDNQILLEATSTLFSATISCNQSEFIEINQEGLISSH